MAITRHERNALLYIPMAMATITLLILAFFAPPANAASTPVTIHSTITFYAAYDNDPAGSTQIAYGKSSGYATVHDTAGGTGTYNDPITIAAHDAADGLAAGAHVWIANLQKYGIIEDYCATCSGKWIDIYLVGGYSSSVLTCEDALTPANGWDIILHPVSTYAVNPNPNYNPANGHCSLLPGSNPA